jgi:hypothetical protein
MARWPVLLLLLMMLLVLLVLLSAQQVSQHLAVLQAQLPKRQQCSCCLQLCTQRQQQWQCYLAQHVEFAAALAPLPAHQLQLVLLHQAQSLHLLAALLLRWLCLLLQGSKACRVLP